MSETKANDLVDSWNNSESFNAGLTKREYFAGQALVGLSMQTEYTNVKDIAETCVQMADALIKALNEKVEDESL